MQSSHKDLHLASDEGDTKTEEVINNMKITWDNPIFV